MRKARSYPWTALVHPLFPLMYSKHSTGPTISNSSKQPFRNNNFLIKSLSCHPVKSPAKSMKSDTEGLHDQTSVWGTDRWAGSISPSKCNHRCFKVSCKHEAVEWLWFSSIWVIWVQHCFSKLKQQWLPFCHPVPTWLLRDLCIYIYLVLPTLPGSCCPLSPSLIDIDGGW